MAQPLAARSERVDLSAVPEDSRWRHLEASDVSVISDVYEDADMDLTAQSGVTYKDLGTRADVLLHGGITATSVPMGLLAQDKALIAIFATKCCYPPPPIGSFGRGGGG